MHFIKINNIYFLSKYILFYCSHQRRFIDTPLLKKLFINQAK